MPTRVEIESLPGSDVELAAFRWLEGGRDVELTLVLPGAPGRTATLTARWLRDLKVSIDLSERGGLLLTWESDFRRLDDGWSVHLDFAHEGDISFRCSELSAEIEELS